VGLHAQGTAFLLKSRIPFLETVMLCVLCVWCADDETVRTTATSTNRGPILDAWKMF